MLSTFNFQPPCLFFFSSLRAAAHYDPAYDHFPCQYQIWYRGKARNSFWYNPVFKVQTLDGKEVWRRSDYRCKRGDVPGTFYFTFMDNGRGRDNKWHRIIPFLFDIFLKSSARVEVF